MFLQKVSPMRNTANPCCQWDSLVLVPVEWAYWMSTVTNIHLVIKDRKVCRKIVTSFFHSFPLLYHSLPLLSPSMKAFMLHYGVYNKVEVKFSPFPQFSESRLR